MMMTETSDAILRTLEQMLRETIGDELLLAGPLTSATSFSSDLELESIELVVLAEKLQQHYGVDFVAWLSAKELDQIIALTVGDLVELITSCRS